MKKVKKEKVKKKFSFWRLLSYIGCYVFVTFASAFVVVSVNSSTYSFNPPKLNSGSGAGSSSLLGNMVTSFMSMTDLQGSMNLTLDDGKNKVQINGDLTVVLYEELSGAEVKGDFVLNINGEVLNFDILYKDNMYITLNGNKLMIDTNSAIEGIMGVLALSGINMDLGGLAGSLDMSILDTLGEYITEKTVDDGFELIAEYDDISATIQLDKEYNIKGVTTPAIEFGGTKLTFDLDIDNTNSGTKLETPTDTGVNITPLVRLAEGIVNTINSESINFNGNIAYRQNEIGFDGLYRDDSLMLLSDIMGQKVDLYYKNNTAYIDCGYAQIKGNYYDVKEIAEIIYDLLPNEVKDTLEDVSSTKIDTKQLIGGGFELLDSIKNIDWDIVEKEDYIAFVVEDKEVRFYLHDNKIDAILFDIADIEFDLEFSYYDNVVVVPSVEFISLGDMSSLIRPIYNLALTKELSLNIALTDTKSGKDYVGTLALDFEDLRFDFNANIYNKDIQINYVDEYIYAKIDDVYVSTHQNNVFGLIVYLANNYSIDLSGVEILQGNEVLRFVNTDDQFYSVAFGNIAFDFEVLDDYIVGLSTSIADFDINADITYGNVEFDNIDFDRYEKLDLSKENLEFVYNNVVDYIEREEYNFNIDFTYQDFDVKGYVGYNKGDFAFDLAFEIMDRPIRLMYTNNIGYLLIDELQIKCDKDTLFDIVGYVINVLGIEIPAIADSVDSISLPSIEDIEKTIEKVSMSLYNDRLTMKYDDIVANIQFGFNAIKNIDIAYRDINLKLYPTYNRTIVIPEGEYVDVKDVVDLISSINNIIERKYGTLNIDLTYGEINIVGQIKIDLNGVIRLEGNLQILGKNIIFYYIDEKIYITYDSINICTTIEDIATWLEGYVDIDKMAVLSMISKNNNGQFVIDYDRVFELLNSVVLRNTEKGFEIGILSHNIKLDCIEGEITGISGSEFGVDFAIGLDHSKPVFAEINTNDFDYLDISRDNILDIKDSIIDYIENEKYYFDITFNYEGYEVVGYVEYEDGDFEFALSTTLLDNTLDIVLKDNVVYVSYANVKVQCALADLSKIIGYVIEKSGITLPENSDSEFSFDIDLNDIENILTDITVGLIDGQLIVYYDKYTLNVDLNNTKLNGIAFGGFGGYVNVDLCDKKPVIIPEGEYVNLDNVYDLVKPIENIISRKYANLSYCIEIADIEVSGDINIDLRNGVLVSGSAKAYGKTIYFDYVDGKVYISVDDMKVHTTIKDLLTLKEYIESEENKDLTLNDIVREENNLVVNKTQLDDKNNAYKVGFANYSITFVVNSGEFVSLAFADFGVDATINFSTKTPSIRKISAKEYQYVDLTYENIESLIGSIKTYIEKEEYYFNISATYDKYSVNGWVGYDGEIKAHITTTIIGKELEITLLNNIVYIDFDGLKLQCAISDIDEILTLLENEWGVSLGDGTTASGKGIAQYLVDLILSNNNLILKAQYNDIYLGIDFSNYTFNSLSVKYDKVGDSLSMISATITPCTAKNVSVSGKYLDLASLTDVVAALNKTFKSGTISGEVDLYIDFAGTQNILELDYGIKYIDGQYQGYINTEFKGLNVNIYLLDSTLYIDIVGMKIFVEFNEYQDVIDWLNDKFDLGIDIEAMKENSGKSIEDISFDFLNSWVISNKYIQANMFNNLILEVYYDTLINKVVFKHGDIKADLYCTSFKDFNLNNINTAEYTHYSIVTKTVDDVMNTLKKKDFDITANAKSYKDGKVDENGNKVAAYDVDLALQVSFSDILAIYGSAIVNDDTSVEVSWENNYAYINYDGLKLACGKDGLIEIAAIALQLFGVDITGIKLFENVGEDFIVEADNFASFLPEMEASNPLDMLQYIKSLSIEKGVFTLILNGDVVGQNINDMTAKLYTNNGTIYRLELRDINVGGGETFDLTIDLNTFKGVNTIADKTGFYDITPISQLLKAFVNTSTLRDYHLMGDVKLAIAGIDGLVTLGVDVMVKPDENNDLTIDITITGMPLLSGFTDYNTNHASSILTVIGKSYRTRTINMYIKKGYVYIETDDEEFSSWGSKKERYLRTTKVPLNYLFNNLEYYMQYILGFSGSIQDSIVNAINESKNNTDPIDYSKVLSGYEYNNHTHTIILNLATIARNSQLGDLTLGITTRSDASTNHKDFLYELYIDVSFLDLITISTDNNNKLELVDIGKTLDLSTAENYIKTYSYNTFGEYQKSGSGGYSQSNGNNVTLTFHQNAGYSDLTVTGITGSYFDLPQPTCVSYIGSDGVEYAFNGWYYYTNTEKTKLSQWKYNYLPKDSIELYGSWEKRYTLTLINGEDTYATYKLFNEESKSLPEIESYFVNIDGVQEYHEFLGWYDGLRKYDNVEMTKRDLTLYAKWDVYNYYTVTFINNGEIHESLFKAENDIIAISELENYTTIVDGKEVVYKWCGWYLGDKRVIGSYVVDGDATLTAKWEAYPIEKTKTFTIMDGDTVLYSGQQVIGQEIVLPNNVNIVDSTLWYTDKALSKSYGELNIMPNEDLTLYICNKFELTIEYSQFKKGRRYTIVEKHKVYQNTDIASYIPAQVSGEYDDGTQTKCVYYNFTGWDNSTRIMPNGDMKITANWQLDTKYYYTITFDTSNKPDGRDFSIAPTTPESVRQLEGTTLDLNDAKYQPTCQTSRWIVISTKYYNYIADGWSYTSSESTSGGGQKSFVIDSNRAVNGVITLYPCWLAQ